MPTTRGPTVFIRRDRPMEPPVSTGGFLSLATDPFRTPAAPSVSPCPVLRGALLAKCPTRRKRSKATGYFMPKATHKHPESKITARPRNTPPCRTIPRRSGIRYTMHQNQRPETKDTAQTHGISRRAAQAASAAASAQTRPTAAPQAVGWAKRNKPCGPASGGSARLELSLPGTTAIMY